jgi:hypothetical protein
VRFNESAEGARGPEGGVKGSCGTPGNPGLSYQPGGPRYTLTASRARDKFVEHISVTPLFVNTLCCGNTVHEPGSNMIGPHSFDQHSHACVAWLPFGPESRVTLLAPYTYATKCCSGMEQFPHMVVRIERWSKILG